MSLLPPARTHDSRRSDGPDTRPWRVRALPVVITAVISTIIAGSLAFIIFSGRADTADSAATAATANNKTNRVIRYLKGEQGIPGVPGKNGVDGAPGPAGRPGVRGRTGRTGERGPFGRAGAQGRQGRQGRRGAAGVLPTPLNFTLRIQENDGAVILTCADGNADLVFRCTRKRVGGAAESGNP